MNNARCFVKILFVGASPSGKASAFGADIRWFESSRPSHKILNHLIGGFFILYQTLTLFDEIKHKIVESILYNFRNTVKTIP